MVRFAKLAIVLVAVGLALTGCSSDKKTAKLDPFAGKGSPYYTGKGPIPWGGGRRHVGKPYQVAGRWFTPEGTAQLRQEGHGLVVWRGISQAQDIERRVVRHEPLDGSPRHAAAARAM